MKVTGIIILVLGILGTTGQLIIAAQGNDATFAPIAFVVLGLFLISRANNKKEEEEKKKQWENSSKN